MRRIDDVLAVRIQLSQSIDQGKSFGCTVHAWGTHRMVPHQGGNVGLAEEGSDRRSTGVERELRPSSEVKNPFFLVRRWWLGVNECPATIKDRLSEIFGHIDRREICRAESRHEQDKLEVGHSGIMNIESWHGLHYRKR